MAEAKGPEYRPLWLTAEEHQTLFAELLGTPEGFREERLADLLKKADARGQGVNVQMDNKDGGASFTATSSTRNAVSLDGSALLGARRTFRVLLLGMAFLALAACLYSLLVRH